MSDKIVELLEKVEDLLSQTRELIGLQNGQSEFHNGSTLQAGKPSINITSDGKVAVGSNGLTINYRGVDNCPYGKTATQKQKPFTGIILHHNNPAHSLNWLVNYQINGDPSRGGHFGYHFYVDMDGSITQGAPLTKRTNHVKPLNMPQRTSMALGRNLNNTNAIGISCVKAGQSGGFKPTSAQVKSVKNLADALCNEYDIALQDIYGHGEVQSDRHETEGRSIARKLRQSGAASNVLMKVSAQTPSIDDDMDDSAIDAYNGSQEMSDLENTNPPHWNLDNDPDWPSSVLHDEDDDDLSEEVWVEHSDAVSVIADNSQHYGTALRYINGSSIRRGKVTKNMEHLLIHAVLEVFGAGAAVHIYSGGQPRPGQPGKRTGSIRHDDYGNGGRAADVYVYDSNNQQITGIDLARLGQYWLASGYGCVGHEMKRGGIHLDEWTTPPPGGGRFWTYSASDSKPWAAKARKMLEQGAKGHFPSVT